MRLHITAQSGPVILVIRCHLVAIANGSVEFCEAAPIGLADES